MSISQLDYSLFQWINNMADHSPFLDTIMRFLSNDAEYLFYLGVIVYWFTRRDENRRMVVTSLASAVVAFGVGGLISHFFYRDRPFVTHVVHQLVGHAANASFPSDHAIGGFVIASSIWVFRHKDGRVWLLLAALIGFSRIWNGIHYPLDVVAGALLGVLATAIVHWAFTRLGLLRKGVEHGISLYERIEERVWPKQQTGH